MSEVSEFELSALTLVREFELLVLAALTTRGGSGVKPCSRLADTRVVAVSRVNTFSPTNTPGLTPGA